MRILERHAEFNRETERAQRAVSHNNKTGTQQSEEARGARRCRAGQWAVIHYAIYILGRLTKPTPMSPYS